MKFRKSLKRVFLGLLAVVILTLPGSLSAQHAKVPFTHMSTPFGTPQYTVAVAFEEVFKKSGSWLQWKAQETPGAMYMIRYSFLNRAKMAAGLVPQIGALAGAGGLPYIVEGRPPFKKFKIPSSRAAFSMPSYATVFVTFDPTIKTLKDLEGKKVGIAEKSRPFQSTIALAPYFRKGLKNWSKIDWQFLGTANSKDALLNNKIDVHYATFMGSVEVAADGSYYSKALAPGPGILQLMNAGRKLYFIPWDPVVLKKATDFSKDMIAYPLLIEKGTIQGLNVDLWSRVTTGIFQLDESVPDDVIEEMIRVRQEYRKELGRYHAILKLMPDNPYPLGTPEHLVHPGVKKAMRNLGIPIPVE